MDIVSYLTKRGWTGVDSRFRGKIDEWLEWYQGDVSDFHHYSVFNGVGSVKRLRRGLGMAKTVTEDWANLLLNEKVQISAGSFQRQLDDILHANRWGTQSNRLIELAFALGTGALVEYLGEGGIPNIDYIRADMIFPLSWDNGDITECAFGSLRMQDKTECIYLQIHRFGESGAYQIENHLFNNDSGQELPLDGVAEVVGTGSASPLFQIITPNIVNNVDLDCPMGVSVYANAISALQDVDLVFDSYASEFELGRKRIFIPMSMAKIEDMGANPEERLYRPSFDPRDCVFYALEIENAEKPVDVSLPLRTAEHQTGIRDALNVLSLKCGLGTDRYSFESSGVKTATEVVSEKSDLFQNLKKHEHILSEALTNMVKALAYLSGASEPEVTVMFDDSIINDDNTKIDNNIKLVGAGLKSKLSALMDIYGYSEQEAAEELARIVEENRSVSGADIDLFGEEPEQRQKIGFSPNESEDEEEEAPPEEDEAQ